MKENFETRITRLKRKLLESPSLSLLPLIGNLLSGAYLVSLGMPIDGISVGMFFLLPGSFLLPIYAGLKTRKIVGILRSSRSSFHTKPKEFWEDVHKWFSFYLLISILNSIGVIGRYANGFGWI